LVPADIGARALSEKKKPCGLMVDSVLNKLSVFGITAHCIGSIALKTPASACNSSGPAGIDRNMRPDRPYRPDH
jgi:hypothetical protein